MESDVKLPLSFMGMLLHNHFEWPGPLCDSGCDGFEHPFGHCLYTIRRLKSHQWHAKKLEWQLNWNSVSSRMFQTLSPSTQLILFTLGLFGRKERNNILHNGQKRSLQDSLAASLISNPFDSAVHSFATSGESSPGMEIDIGIIQMWRGTEQEHMLQGWHKRWTTVLSWIQPHQVRSLAQAKAHAVASAA